MGREEKDNPDHSSGEAAIRSGRGMTLIEVLVSVAVIAMIMVILWSSSGQLMNAKERVKQRDRAYQQMRGVLVKMEADLSSAFLSRSVPIGTPEGMEGAEIPGRMTTFFKGKDSDKGDELSLTTFSHLRLFKNSKESDQSQVKYFVQSSEKYSDAMDLYRIEIPWLDADTNVEGEQVLIAEGIREFNLSYYDDRKDEWTREWDSDGIDWKGKLPKAVKVIVSVVDPNDKDKVIVLMTSFMVPLSKGMVQL